TCRESKARAGELVTPHGVVPTPVFLPVASQGTVKTLTPEEVKGIGIAMVLANTYHLYLRPGIPVIEKMGGLHKFMAWDRAILTDSGGYQIFSLASLRRVSDEGVIFRSHIDGSQHLITPELAIQFQEALGADIIMVLDECPAYDDSYEKVRAAMNRTHQWAERCQRAQKCSDRALYAIVQGGVFPELRHQSAKYLTSLDFPGYAIGGLSLGEPRKVTLSMIEETVALLPENKPCYLMGIGSPEGIIEGVARGIDIFDSALPTRVARNGANGLTNYLDRDVDARMQRTRHRALPSKRINPPEKVLPLVIGLVIIGLALAWQLHPLCFLADLIGTTAALVWRKRATCVFPQGMLASCAPVLIGWFAIEPAFSWEILLLCTLIAVWLPLHVWSVMIANREDYIGAGLTFFPMSREVAEAVKVLLVLSLVLCAASIALYLVGGFALLYLIVASILSIIVVYASSRLVISSAS
ncbi:unnamed protein product, partial [marine sediment metagenome]